MYPRSPSQSAADIPLLRVSRPVTACSRCRKAKIRCDEKLPACSACEKSGRGKECSSVNDQFSKGKERSYVASLESRVEKLEKRIAYAKSRKDSVAMGNTHEALDTLDRKDSFAAICAAVREKDARRREAADVNKLVSDFGFLSVNATTRDFEATSTSMTFARLILAATNYESVPNSRTIQLPSRAASMKLVTYYLENVFALFPIFHETALFNALDAVYQGNGQPLLDFEHWLFYMVIAIGSTAQSTSNNDAFYTDGVFWVGMALRHADQVLVPGYISQIQALVLLVQYSMLDPAHFDSWNLVGFACRAIVDLGFHQDPPWEEQTNKNILEMRRNIFYCVYSLDRSISMVHARSFSFTDDSTSVALPSLVPISGPTGSSKPLAGPKSREAALILFQLRRVQSSWYQELFQSSRDQLQDSSTYIWQMCEEMRDWSNSLPDDLSLSFKDFFELELLYSYVYCLAPSCRVQAVSSYTRYLIFEYSISYMQKIFPKCQGHTSEAFYTYHDALRVFFVGSQFLAVLKEDAEQLLSDIPPCVPISSPPPPQLPHHTGVENASRFLKCITHIKETLEIFGRRWEDSKALLSTFEVQAKYVTNSLHRRKLSTQEYSQHIHGPESYQYQAEFEQVGDEIAVEWMGHL